MRSLPGNPNCQDCELHLAAQCVCLMGRGPIPSEVMIIADAPGFKEDQTDRPLSGRGGSILNDLLKLIGLSKRKCYVTHVVKCRTPQGRAPSASELKACKQYLEEELLEVNPKYVLLLGAGALKGVLGKGKITEIHGQVFEKDGVQYLPTFSPNVALKDPKRMDPLRADIERFGRLISGTLEEEVPLDWKEIRTFDDFNEAVQDITESEALAFDIETSGLDRFASDAAVRCLGIATSNQRQWVLPLEQKSGRFRGRIELQKQMLEILSSSAEGRKVVAHNGKFDNLWLRRVYGVRFPITFDTMLASHLLDENSPNGLKYLSRVYCHAKDYDIELEEKKGNSSPKKLYEYCAYDVYYTLRLYNLFRAKLLADKPLTSIFKHLLMPASDAFEDIEENGVYVHLGKFGQVERDLKEKIAEIEKRLSEFKKDINWNSTQQVAKFLFQELGLNPLEMTKTGNPSTAEPLLKRMRDEHPVIDVLLEYRENHKQLSAFIKGWNKRMHGDRLHPSFKLHGTVTGRLSCVDPNLQQVPRESTIRSLIGAPPGWTFVAADYSQMELRVAAMMSGDPEMKMVFQTGQDIHTRTAQIMTGRQEVDKEERKKAKAVNFGFLYGMGAPKFRDYARDKYGVNLTESEAKAFRSRFFDTYSALPKWHVRQRRLVRTMGEVRTPIGRVRRLPEIYSPEKGLQSEAERQAINSPVQSFASDITIMAVVELNRRFSRDRVRLVGTVHDSILMEVKDEHLEEVLPALKRIMENPPLLRRFKVRMNIPIVAEVEVGDWGQGKVWNPHQG